MTEIINFFKKCPVLMEKEIFEDALPPKTGCLSILPDGGEEIVKTYSTGDMLGQISFKLLIREFSDGRASKLMGEVLNWLSGPLPTLPNVLEGTVSQYIEVTDCGSLVKSEINSAVYEMKLRLVYYRKGN